MPATQEGCDWLLQPGLQPHLERRFQQLLRTATDVMVTTEEIKLAELSSLTDNQAAYLCEVLQSNT